MFASVPCAYVLWFFFGIFGAHVRARRLALASRALCTPAPALPTAPHHHHSAQRFYVGRHASGLVWLFTFGLFGVGWIIDVFLIPEFVEEHNKRVFHKQMLETGNSLLFDGEYGVRGWCDAAAARFNPSHSPTHTHAPTPTLRAGCNGSGAWRLLWRRRTLLVWRRGAVLTAGVLPAAGGHTRKRRVRGRVLLMQRD